MDITKTLELHKKMKMNLQKTLELHKKWVNNEDGGEQAVLRGADLRNTNLRNTNLCDADLCDANMRGANQCGADLRNTNLRNTNLRDADLCDANLHGAKLCGADLRNTNLRNTNLCDANMRDANLDHSCWPLWCGSLGVHIDDRLAIQLLYHLIYNVDYSKCVSQDVKNVLLTDEIIELANKFHRVDETGKIQKTPALR